MQKEGCAYFHSHGQVLGDHVILDRVLPSGENWSGLKLTAPLSPVQTTMIPPSLVFRRQVRGLLGFGTSLNLPSDILAFYVLEIASQYIRQLSFL